MRTFAVMLLTFCANTSPALASDDVIDALALCHNIPLPIGSLSDLDQHVADSRAHHGACASQAKENCCAGTGSEVCLNEVANWYGGETEHQMRNLPEILPEGASSNNAAEYAAFLATGPAYVTIFADPCLRLDGTEGPTQPACALRDAVLAFGQVADWKARIEYWAGAK